MPQILLELSLELWTQIFRHLQPESIQLGDSRAKRENLASDTCAFQALQQVCKLFRGVFTENPQWHASLYLPKTVGQSSWESLLVWISRHSAKVQEVHTCTRQGTIAMTSSRLHTFLYPPEFLCSSTNCRLSAFTALTRCCLDVSAFLWVALDLGVLQTLQHLSCLALEGHGSCKNLHLVQHLTTLVVCQASVTASKNCSFVDRLQCLDVRHGEISGMHSAGLAACQKLRHLRCKYAVIGADADMDTLMTDESATFVPSSISQLIVLESLHMDVAQSASLDAEAILELDWLTGLSSLKQIVLWSEYAYIVPSGMSKLSKLEDLWLYFDCQTPSSLDVEWQTLCNLKTVHLVGGLCVFDHRLQGLATLAALQEVHVELNSGIEASCVYFSALVETLQRRAPWITICYQEQDSDKAAAGLEFFNHTTALG